MTDDGKIGRGHHPNSQANLVPGAGAWTPGSAPALKHGLRTVSPSDLTLDPIAADIERELVEDLPIKGRDGGVPGHSRHMVKLCAIGLLRLKRVEAFLELHGREDERGRWRPENDAAVKATEAAARLLERLGLSARSAAKLGVDVKAMNERPDSSTVIALAREAGEAGDLATRAELLRSIGLDGEGVTGD